MTDPQRILIAANPKSGAVSRQQLLAGLQDTLTSDGFAVEICDSLERVRSRTAELHASGSLRAVISAGGDGTAAALANRISAEVPLLIFPLGTENLLAKHLGLSCDIAQARERIRGGKSMAFDVGLANGQMFLVMASCGFDAAVVNCMHATRKGHINRWSYTRPILSALRAYRFPALRIESSVVASPQLASPAENSTLQSASAVQTAAWLFVFNVPRYAANLQFCSQADPLDGQLDICTFKRPGIFRGLGYLSSLWFGRHQRLRDFSHALATRMLITSTASEPVPYQLDGDPGGFLPLEISVLPKRLKLIV